MKKTVRLDISYNGSEYKGYQIRNNAKTIQGEIERVLKILFQKKIKTVGAGRTDSGVHALHQVISFKVLKMIPEKGLKKALNSMLPEDIRVHDVTIESEKFHARFSPKSRTYLFIIYNGNETSPFMHKNCWWVKEKIPYKKLKKTLKLLELEYDFSSFCEKSENKNHVRKIISIKTKKKKNMILVYIKGNSFLRRMIRVIMGTSVAISINKSLNPNEIKKILKKKDRRENPFLAAPPHGLYFYKVEY